MATQEEQLSEFMSAVGLHPQAFPVYYDVSGPFLDAAGHPSGAQGSRVKVTREISNQPHLVYAVRLENVYPCPDEPSAEDVARYRICKEFLDGLQEFEILLTQQNVTNEATCQVNFQGRNHTNLHPFATPFPMAGSNSISVSANRLVGYPTLDDEPVHPTLRVTIVTVQLRADMATVPPHRRGG